MDVLKRIFLTVVIGSVTLPCSVYAAANDADLLHEIALLKNQLHELQMRVASDEQSSALADTDTSARTAVHHKKKFTKKSVSNDSSAKYKSLAITSPAVATPISWHGPDIDALIVGSASAGFSKPSAQYGSFNLLDFNPIFLLGYKDSVFARVALDFSLDDQGNTQTSLNYANLNLFLNDYAVLGAGKFDSALGYFGQNLSAAWINKLADTPVGFGGDQAAPQAEVGIRLSGGFPLYDDAKANYAVFVSNGSQGLVDTTNSVIDHIDTDGFTNNYGNYTIGGRLGFLPIPNVEIGVSLSGGKLVLLDMADGTTVLQNGRHYNSLGADISYKKDNLDLRAEITQQQVSYQTGSIVTQAERWKAWYLQAAYRIQSTNFEPVVRYGKFTSPISNQQQGQLALGLDYWFAPSIDVQVQYDINHGQVGSGANANLFLMQLVFGF